jgi:hypothetical protein
MRLDPRKLPKCAFAKPLCVSIVKTAVKLEFFAFGWLCLDPLAINAFRSFEKKMKLTLCLRAQNPLAQNASRSSRDVVKFWFGTCLLNFFAQNWCLPSDIM